MREDALSRGLACFCVSLIFVLPAPAQSLFKDVTHETRTGLAHVNIIDYYVMLFGTGATWFDYDRDNDLDLYVTQGVGANVLFRNNGDGTFTDVAAQLGVDDPLGSGSGVAAADFNNDGWLDLYLANSDRDILFKNINGRTFVDISEQAGFDTDEHLRGTSISWGDYDNDGFLDLFITNHIDIRGGGYDHEDRLYRNNGDETFTDVSYMMGEQLLSTYGYIGSWTDYDNDHDLDLFLINDCKLAGASNPQPTLLFRNDGGTEATAWTFTEVGEAAGVQECHNGMGIAVGDYNRDGWLDYFYTNIGPALLLQNDQGTLVNTTEAAGVVLEYPNGPQKAPWTWGANFFDYDLDGWLDLFIASGILEDEDDAPGLPNFMYRNNGGSTFTDISVASGLDDDQRGRTSIYADYDGDGDPDLYLVNSHGPSYLFRNENDNGNHWLIVELEGTRSNRDGIGARLTLTTPDGEKQYFETRSGSSLGGGDDLAAYFGLGTQTTATTLEIRWPSGIVQTLTDVPANQRFKVVEVETATTVEEADETLPVETPRLFPGFPNPFATQTTLSYTLGEAQTVELEICDILGRVVYTSGPMAQARGEHTYVWNADVAPGLYVARLSAGHHTQTQLLVKQ